MFTHITSLACIFFIGLSSLAHATSLEAQIQKKYQEVHTISTSFEQNLAHKESGSVQKRHGELFFSKPFLVRWETKTPHAELLLIGKDMVWNYLPDEEVAYTYSPEIVEGSRSLVQVITGQAQLSKDFAVKNAGKEEGYTKLILYPHDPSPDMVEAIIWVDDANLIRKASIIDFYGNSNTLAFTKITLNQSLTPDTFTFTPPKGVDVENGIRQ